MSTDKAEKVFRELSALVIKQHNNGASKTDIARSLELLGMDRSQSGSMVEKIIELYKSGVDVSKQPTFLESNPLIREVVCFLGGVAMVFVTSMALSFLLGVADMIFNAIGLGDLGTFLVKMGEKAAGLLMGVLGTAASSESRSIGMFIGCWIGSGLYYWWLFENL